MDYELLSNMKKIKNDLHYAMALLGDGPVKEKLANLIPMCSMNINIICEYFFNNEDILGPEEWSTSEEEEEWMPSEEGEESEECDDMETNTVTTVAEAPPTDFYKEREQGKEGTDSH